MTTRIVIHAVNPQPRLIQRIVTVLHAGGVIVYPTDSSYALGCALGASEATQRIRHIRQINTDHPFALICRDLSDIANYAYVSNPVFRILKAYTPAPYTFILPATRAVPKRFQNPKRKTVGLRIPNNPITLAILKAFSEPLISVTLDVPALSSALRPVIDMETVSDFLRTRVDLIVDGGGYNMNETTVVDLSQPQPKVLRIGLGDPRPFERS